MKISGASNTIGGLAPEARNIISGNYYGIQIFFESGNMVQGNYIGTDVTGMVAVPNTWGVSSDEGSIIGGAATVLGTPPGNLISGNSGGGIDIYGANNTVLGNSIGLNSAGTGALPNAVGVELVGPVAPTADNNDIGRAGSGEGNVISGNAVGVFIGGNATGNELWSNLIGTDLGGLVDIGNSVGVSLTTASNFIGAGVGSQDADCRTSGCNIISGNGVGVEVSGPAGNVVISNRIGMNLNGAALPNDDAGIRVLTTATIVGNTVSGNTGPAVHLAGASATGSSVTGNRIGASANGVNAIPNGQGVLIDDGAHDNDIGSVDLGGNQIAFNTGAGVVVESGLGNHINANQINGNGGLGIDLAGDGLTANDDEDPDSGPNNLQNFPVLEYAYTGSTVVKGSLNSLPNSSFHLEFFASPTCDPSGLGEGAQYLGFTDVATSASGNAPFTASLPTTATVGQAITATAIGATGNTSEFAGCVTMLTEEPTPSPTGQTPTPTATPTATPTPTPSGQTQTATQSATKTQGDVNCDGMLDEDDFAFLLGYAAEMNDGSTPDPCPDLGEALPASAAAHPWGDVNCDGAIDALDALYVLAHTAGIDLPQTPPCTPIGQAL